MLTQSQLNQIFRDNIGRNIRSFEVANYQNMTPDQVISTLAETYPGSVEIYNPGYFGDTGGGGNTGGGSTGGGGDTGGGTYIGDGNYSTGTGSGYYVSPTQSSGGITDIAPVSNTPPPTGGSDYTSQLNEIYQQVFGRDVADPGVGFYTPLLESGQLTIDQVRDDVIKNALGQVYQDELGRPLGQEGLNFYGPYLQSGDLSLDDIRQYVASDAANDTGQYTPLPSGGIATIGAPITGGDTGGGTTGGDTGGGTTGGDTGGGTTGGAVDPIEQQVIDAYANAFGPDRVPRQTAIDAYAQALESGYFTPEALVAELQESREGQIRAGLNAQGIQNIPLEFIDFAVANPDFTVDQIVQAGVDANADYNFSLDRNADPNGFVSYARNLLEGVPREQLRAGLIDSDENTTNTGQLGDIGAPGGIALDTSGDLASLADLAYTLARSNQLDFPEYQVAGFSPEQEIARAEFNENRGIYEPFLQRGDEATLQGIGALGEALAGTRGAIPHLASVTNQGMADLGRSQEATRDAQQYITSTTLQGMADLGEAKGDIQRFAGEGAEAADIASQRARQSTEEAQRALQEASGFGLGAAQQGIAGLQGSGEMYTPDMIRPYMNEYEDAAVQQALSDLARQGELQKRQIEFNAVQAGAFGGSRQAVAEQELARNVMEEQGRTAAQMRNTGYESAAQRSQQAFEDAMRRRQQGAMYTGQLGQIGSGAAATAAESGGRLGLDAESLAQTGGLSGAQMQMTGAGQAGELGLQSANLGLSGIGMGLNAQQQAGNLGLQSANLGLSGIQAGLGAQQQAAGIGQGIAGLGQQSANMGGLAQQYQAQDLSTLMQMGQMGQGQQQAEYDAARMNAYQDMMVPFQQLAFASDIMTQTPTGITSVMSQPIQGPSLLSQIGGLVFGGANLAKALG